MEIIQYTLFSITTILGLFLGALISYLTPNEQESAKKYFRRIILPLRQEKVFVLLGFLFAFLSPSQYLFLTATLVFLYSIPVGSLLYSQKNKKSMSPE